MADLCSSSAQKLPPRLIDLLSTSGTEDEHLPQALAAFEAKRAWRCWSKLDPSVHYAFYEFSDADAALTVVHSAANKHLGSLFDEAWGGRVTRTRDAVETVHALPHSG